MLQHVQTVDLRALHTPEDSRMLKILRDLGSCRRASESDVSMLPGASSVPRGQETSPDARFG